MRKAVSAFSQCFKCIKVDINKWAVTPRIIVAFILLGFLEYNSIVDIGKLCKYYGIGCSPWVFPFYMGHPTMGILLGAVFILFYCDAPFFKRDSMYMVMRMGKSKWITGQVLYIVVSSFLITIYHVIVSILTVLPFMEFTTDWGRMLYMLVDGTIPDEVMVTQKAMIGILPNVDMMNLWKPIELMVLSAMLLWFHIMFIAFLIMAVNTAVKHLYGAVIAGFLVGFQYFANYIGRLSFGDVIFYFSPLSWVSVNNINYSMDHTGRAGPEYVYPFLIISILIFIGVSIAAFCRRDIEAEKGEF